MAENIRDRTNMTQRMARIAISIGAMALWINAATAQDNPSALNGGGNKLQRALVTAWQALNEDCRGGSGNSPRRSRRATAERSFPINSVCKDADTTWATIGPVREANAETLVATRPELPAFTAGDAPHVPIAAIGG